MIKYEFIPVKQYCFGVYLQLVSALPSRPLPEKLSDGTGLEDEGAAFADADPVQSGKRSFKRGMSDTPAPRFGRDGKRMKAASPNAGAAEEMQPIISQVETCQV